MAPAATRSPVKEVMDALWERDLADGLFLRLQEGLPIEELPDLSYEKAAADAELSRRQLARLAAVDPRALSAEDRLSLAVLQHSLRTDVETFERCAWHFSPITPYLSPLPLFHRALNEHRFQNGEDAARYLRLLDQYPDRLGQIEALLRGQLERGLVLPRAELQLVIPMLGTYIREPGESLFQVAEERLGALGPEAAGALRQAVAQRIRESLNPALTGLSFFLAGAFEAKAPVAVGLGQYPGGEACYRHLVRTFTTLELSPEEIHQIGRAEVERIAAQMAEVQARLGFAGSRADFHRALRQDPRFRPASAEAIGERLRSYMAGMEARVGELFSLTPKAPYAVERLDPSLEAGMTFGYYRPPTEADPRGVYFYNGSNPAERPLFWAQALLYHELVPGHHFQIALQEENEDLHPWRQNYLTSAYTEGWAEYASSLGEELGLYQDLYELYGRYAHEIFLASRLVVDTGMNHLGWSREQAMDWLRDYTLETETQIATETLRYSVDMPGQALAYKIGAITIHRLRRKAADALGEAFDLRAFHRAVLEPGNLPLGVLAEHLEGWIAAQGRRTPPGGV